MWALGSCALAILLGAWLYFAEYTRRELCVGRVVPVGGIAKVRSRSAGDIVQLKVREGDIVKKGDLIAIITADRSAEVDRSLGDQVIASLTAQRDSLSDDKLRRAELTKRQRREINEQIELIDQQISEGETQLDVLSAETENQLEQLRKFESLIEQDYISEVQVQQQRSQVAVARTNQIRQRSQLASLRQQRSQLKERLENASLESISYLSGLQRELSQLDIQSEQSTVEARVLLRAPASGKISSLLVYPGQSVVAGEVVASIIGEGSDMEAELLVASTTVGFISERTSVSIRYSAYPFQKYGMHKGQIVSVSRTPLSPAEIVAITGDVEAKKSLYRVRIRLPGSHLAYGDVNYPLAAGMAVEGDVVLDRRRMYEYLFESLLKMRARSS